jgi:hypothetical protein
MSKWGHFYDTPDGSMHVAPCDKQGNLLEPHILSETCQCKPDWIDNKYWVHNDPEKGGFNA